MAKLRDARTSRSEDQIRQATAALLDARQASLDAHRTASIQGSGAPGDIPAVSSNRGSIVDLYA